MENLYYSIASGSTGNCALLTVGGERILLDMGVSLRTLTQALKTAGLAPGQLSAVLVTHEHSDHIKGISTFCKKYDVPVYCSEGTARELLSRVPHVQDSLSPFASGDSFAIGGVQILSMPTPHDAADSVAYRISGGGQSFAYVTDLGFMPSTVMSRIAGCETVVLESNHDVTMLENGPYPLSLKKRVRGNRGHLSNGECALCAVKLAENGTKRLILAHLSENNNTPLTAFRETRDALALMGCACDLYVAPKGAMEKPLYFEEEPCCLCV